MSARHITSFIGQCQMWDGYLNPYYFPEKCFKSKKFLIFQMQFTPQVKKSLKRCGKEETLRYCILSLLKNRKFTPVLCDQVTKCLGSLTISLVSTTSTNDAPIIASKRIMNHTRSHESIRQHMWTAAHALISSQNRLLSHYSLKSYAPL